MNPRHTIGVALIPGGVAIAALIASFPEELKVVPLVAGALAIVIGIVLVALPPSREEREKERVVAEAVDAETKVKLLERATAIRVRLAAIEVELTGFPRWSARVLGAPGEALDRDRERRMLSAEKGGLEEQLASITEQVRKIDARAQ